MSDAPFAPFPLADQFSGQWNGPAGQATDAPKKRGPRRGTAQEEAAPVLTGVGVAKPKGRPKKAAAEPAQQSLNLTPLFQILAGLQTADVVPLTSCYELLAALPPPDRSRVLGMLNRVLG